MGSSFLCQLLTHSNIKMKSVILAVVVITICSLSVVQSRPKKRDSLEDPTADEVVVEDYLQKNKKNIIEKADLDDYDYSASSKNVKRVNLPDDGPGAAYGYFADPTVVHVAAPGYPY